MEDMLTANRAMNRRVCTTQKTPTPFDLNSLKGIRGFSAIRPWIRTKKIPNAMHAAAKESMTGWSQGNLRPPRDKMRRKVVIVRINVTNPGKSM